MAEDGDKRDPVTHRTRKQTTRHNKTYGDKPEQKEKDRKGHRIRYKLEKEGRVKKHDGKDVNHKTMLKDGGTNAESNIEVISKEKNRGHGTSPGGRPKSKDLEKPLKKPKPKPKPKPKKKRKGRQL
jgi:hypothetical protein